MLDELYVDANDGSRPAYRRMLGEGVTIRVLVTRAAYTRLWLVGGCEYAMALNW